MVSTLHLNNEAMTPNNAWDRARSRSDVYEQLLKIRAELEDLRRRCGRKDSEAKALRETCRRQEEELQRFKRTHEEVQVHIKHLQEMLSKKDAELKALKESSTDHNANSQPFQLLDRLVVAERYAQQMEEEANNLNILLSKKAVELNQLQLRYSKQSKKLLEITRDNSTSSRNTSSLDISFK